MTARILKDHHTAISLYQIEARFPDTASEGYRGKWYSREMTMADFGERYEQGREKAEDVRPHSYQYGSCGAAWQLLGEHGYLYRRQAERAFEALKKHARPCEHVAEWRLVHRVVSVDNTILDGFKAKSVGEKAA